MTTIESITVIHAPIETCFQLSLSIDLEIEAVKSHHLRAVSGVTSGMINTGQRVGWQTKQFGMTVSHESEITGFERPFFFQDTMVAGLFQTFQHDHFFRGLDLATTEMRDVMKFSLPLWMLGLLSERLVVRSRLKTLLDQRNRLIKSYAESPAPPTHPHAT